jgi:intein/homing endonuclease
MLSKLEILHEYAKCLSDPIYAIESYLKTFDKTQDGFVRFLLFPRQKEIINAYEDHRYNIVSKPRQAGVSTTTAAYMAIKTGFGDIDNPEKILIIANKQTMAQEFLSKIKDFIDQLPRWIWGDEYYGTPEKESKSIFIRDSKGHIILPNKCEIKAVATSKDALRGFTPTYLIFDEAAFIDNGEIVFNAAMTSIGCIKKDSLILTKNGLIKLDKLIIDQETPGFTKLNTPYEVCNRYGNISKAVETFVSGYGEVYKIKTKLGLELTGSFKHPILVSENGENIWRKLSEIKITDKPIIGYNQNYFGNMDIDFKFTSKNYNMKEIIIPNNLSENKELCYLLGLFISEGNFKKHGIQITNTDEYIRNFLINDEAKIGKCFKQINNKRFDLDSLHLKEFINYLGINKSGAKNKIIPEIILQSNKDVIKNVLQGMFDGDGCATTKEIKYTSVSEELIKTLQILLLNFGIISHIRKTSYKTSETSILSNKEHICEIYNLFIYSDYALKFFNEIGFRLNRKQNKITHFENKKMSKRFINITQNEIKCLLKKHNLPVKKVRFLERFFNSKYQRLSYSSFERLEKIIQDDIFVNYKKQIDINKNYYIDEVVSIEKSFDYTYDLHVPDTNSFISNSFISHNTGGHCILISCVTDDTFVYTDNGIEEVSDFIDYTKNVGEPYKIDEYKIFGLNDMRKSNLIVNNGKQPICHIKTTSSELKCTETHLLWGYSNKLQKFGWLNAKYLNVNDYVNIQYGFNNWGNNDGLSLNYNFSNKEHKPQIIFNKITPDLAYLIGLYVAEGSAYKTYNDNGEHIGTSITITCGDDISASISNCGFKFSSYDKLHYTISSKYLGALLEFIGFDLSLKAPKKILPKKLLSLSKDATIGLIQGIMDGDGYSDSKRGRIGISLSSEKLIKQLRALLLNFGILCDYQTGVTPITKKVKIESRYYRISAISYNAKKYYDEIGFRFNRKQKNKEILKDKLLTYQDFIPNGKIIIRNIIDDNNLSKKLRKTGLLVNKLRYKETDKTKDLNSETFNKFIRYFEEELLIDLSPYNIDKILFKNSKWEKIKSISYSEEETFDFSLPNNENDYWAHSVIYNGILGHQTPNGHDPLYYATYEGSKTGENDFNIVEMRWYEDLRYNKDLKWFKEDKETKEKIIIDEIEFNFESYEQKIKEGYKPTSSWYENMCRNMNHNAKMIAQELDVSFIGSGGNVINDEYIQFHEKNNVKDPLYVDGILKEYWIWNKPVEGHQYILASDVSRGDGEDYSTICIIDFTTMEQVMEYRGKVQPDLLAQIIYEYGNLYNAYAIVDITGGMGVATVLKLLDMGYKHLHYDDPKTKLLSTKDQLTQYQKEGGKIPGFNVGASRLPMIAHFERCVRENTVFIRSRRLTSEMKTFIYRNGRPDHADGKHDDTIMAMAMALFVLEHSFKKLEKLEKQTKAMLDSWSVGAPVEETKAHGRPKPNFSPVVAKNMQDPRGEYLWLFGGFK